MSGSCPFTAPTNSPKKPEPMPTMTASTITLMPDETTVAEHSLGEEARAVPEGERHQHEPAERVSLNSRW
jgi:hypothetical protein